MIRTGGPRAVAAVLLAILSVACNAEPARAPTPQVTAPPPRAPGSDLSSGNWGEFRSRRFDLSIPLPDGKAWRIDDHSTQWLEAQHAASSSSLSIRVWREDENMNRNRCELKVRGWKKLPPRDDWEVLRQERLDIPPEFDTAVDVGLVAPRPGAQLEAFVFAFGGWAHRCFAYVYRTTASGKGAEGIIGARLAAMVDGSLSKIAYRSDLAPTIPREPAR